MKTNLTTNQWKRSLTAAALIFICQLSAVAGITVGNEYYIWLNIYEKLLGTNDDDTGPALSAYGTNPDADSYVFIAESSGTDGYVLLRQKSSNKYLAASNANSYNMTLENSRSTDSRYLWT